MHGGYAGLLSRTSACGRFGKSGWAEDPNRTPAMPTHHRVRNRPVLLTSAPSCEQALVFVRQHPDSVGNLNSPLGTVYEQGSFVAALTELAFTAEIARSQPQIVTQLRKPEKGSQLDAGALFFDAESRNAATDQEGEESGQAARALEMQARLCEVMCAYARFRLVTDAPLTHTHTHTRHVRSNKLQTRGGDQGGGGGTSATRPPYMPPDVPPKLFTLPKVSSHLKLHTRYETDTWCARRTTSSRPTWRCPSRAPTSRRSCGSAWISSARRWYARHARPTLRPSSPTAMRGAQGIPAALVFEGRFSNNSTAQYARVLKPTAQGATHLAPLLRQAATA